MPWRVRPLGDIAEAKHGLERVPSFVIEGLWESNEEKIEKERSTACQM